MGYVVLYVVLLLVGMVLVAELGLWVGRRRLRGLPHGAALQSGAFEASMLGLLGLLLAFTFSGAGERFDLRRALIVQETNDVGTAWLRLDLLPGDAREEARTAFRAYFDARLDFYRALARGEPPDAAQRAIDERRGELWDLCVAAASRTPDTGARIILLPALNAMFDTGTERTLQLLVHPPLVVYLLLFVLALVSALLVGHGAAERPGRDWMQRITYAVIVSLTVYVTLDLELPRQGLVRVDPFDAALIELRESLDRG